MKKLVLHYIGRNYWDNKSYKDDNGKIYVDLGNPKGVKELYTVFGGIDGDPSRPISEIEEYKGVEIEIQGEEDETTEEERFNYMMLGRLKMDCDYYLGNGNRYTGHLWAHNEQAQIKEMKKLYNWFDDDKKPQWLTWEQILDYEERMKKNSDNQI
jgi:hypothetical protein